MTAKTEKGTVITVGRKEYWEVGLDLNGDHRLGAWQIKEILDLSLPPRQTTRERFLAELPLGTRSAEIEIKVTYSPAPATELLIHSERKALVFQP